MMMLFSPVSSTMITRFGARVTLSVGAVIVSAGYLVAVLLMDAPWQLMVARIVACSGVGVAYAAMPTLVMDNTPRPTLPRVSASTLSCGRWAPPSPEP